MLLKQHTAHFLLNLREPFLVARARKQIEVAAPRVDEIGDRQVQPAQYVARSSLCQHLQIERPAAQRRGRTTRRDGVDEVLHTTDVAADQHGNLLIAFLCCLFDSGQPSVVDIRPVEHGRQGCGHTTVVIEADIWHVFIVGGRDAPGIALEQQEHRFQIGRKVTVRFVDPFQGSGLAVEIPPKRFIRPPYLLRFVPSFCWKDRILC